MPPQYHEIKEQAHHPHDQHGDPDQFVIQDGPCHVFEETDTRGTRSISTAPRVTQQTPIAILIPVRPYE